MLFKKKKLCRLCNSKNLIKVISLGKKPPANAFLKRNELKSNEKYIPLDLFFCNNCSHLQLGIVVNPKTLFKNYVYVSGTSKIFFNHFKLYANQLIKKHKLNKDDLVVDIGSNDGTFLSFFKKKKIKILGVDPAKKISNNANKKKIKTINNFFSTKIAKKISTKYGKAKVISANNVFAHIDNLSSFMTGINLLLKNDGIFVTEFSYVKDVIEKKLFDTIYHEHLDYHSLTPLVKFFKKFNLYISEIKKNNSHGGSLRLVVKKYYDKKNLLMNKNVKSFFNDEINMKINKIAKYKTFNNEIKRYKELSVNFFSKIDKKKTIAGYGAPAKLTTLTHYLKIGKRIKFIFDDNILKIGLYTPGYRIKVYDPKFLYKFMPDYTIIFAWNFSKSIIKKHRKYLDLGGKFIIPYPKFNVI